MALPTSVAADPSPHPVTPPANRLGDADLFLGDALQVLRDFPDHSFDLAIADPPYGAASGNEWKIARNHGLAGMGGEWKLADHDWDALSGLTSFQFTLQWLSELRRLVKPTGSIWIHATYHNSGIANVACQLLGLEIINEVIWFKRNAFPNLAARRLTASHETILWVHTGGRKRQYRFNYDQVKAAGFEGDQLKEPGKQLRTVWDVPNNKGRDELKYGKHPTQKPLRLTNRLFDVAGCPGGRALVPFMGSGTEVVAALRNGMGVTGIELDPSYFDLAKTRVAKEVSHRQTRLALP